MPVSDPIADLLTRMRNAQHSRNDTCVCPWSRHKEEICNLLKREKYLEEVQIDGEGKNKKIIVTFIVDRPKLELYRVSKPGRRIYSCKKDLKPVLRGFGIAIVTTSQGLMTDKEAREKGIGGEVLCTLS